MKGRIVIVKPFYFAFAQCKEDIKRGSICMKFSTTGQEKGDLLIQLTA
jgi:hypothetical protein